MRLPGSRNLGLECFRKPKTLLYLPGFAYIMSVVRPATFLQNWERHLLSSKTHPALTRSPGEHLAQIDRINIRTNWSQAGVHIGGRGR